MINSAENIKCRSNDLQLWKELLEINLKFMSKIPVLCLNLLDITRKKREHSEKNEFLIKT
jgi:hypothetical protein